MGSTSLQIAGKTVVETSAGAFHVEYGLFDAGEISLGRNALGRPIEHGYATTAGDALHRLAQLGATPHLAQTCADVMHPTLVQAYARGPMVRKLATLLDSQLLFESGRYDAEARHYLGTFLDLASLAHDLGRPGAGALFQALYLCLLLSGVEADASVELDTRALTAGLKPGERTHHRVALDGLSELPALLQDLANRGGGRGARGPDLERAELLALLDERAMPGADLGAYRSALDTREPPAKGPLARADLWEIELLLDAGDYPAAAEKLEQVERGGRTPATAYQRARHDLLAGVEDPAVLAPRLSALALSMSSFVELGLLAGEAWMAAGDARRASAYANDVVATRGIDATLRERAASVLRGVVLPPIVPRPKPSRPQPTAQVLEQKTPSFFPDPRAEPRSALGARANLPDELDSAPRRPSHPALARVPAPAAPASAPQPAAAPVAAPASAPPPRPEPLVDPPASAPVLVPVPPPSDPAPIGPPSDAEPDEVTLPPNTKAAESEPPSIPTLVAVAPAPVPAPAAIGADLGADFPDPSSPAFSPADDTLPPNASTGRLVAAAVLPEEPAPARAPSAPAPSGVASVAPDPSPGGGPVATELTSEPAPESAVGDAFPPVPVPFPSSFPAEAAPEHGRGALLDLEAPISELPTPTLSGEFMRGASHPPSVEADPVSIFGRAPLFPRSDPDAAELAAELPLPPCLSGALLVDTQPSSVLEARVQNTLLSRELGLRYRSARNVELRADLSGIEHMQAYLFRRFASGVVDGPEGARDLQLHGAFLSEILARRLGAEWTDLSAHELGHWEMLVPPGNRVWPFGRISRLIVKGHKERDLVAYFLELESKRNRARR